MTNNIELEIEKLYNKLLPSIKTIISNYSYLNITEEKFAKLIKEFFLFYLFFYYFKTKLTSWF
jgi:hypothetical protein